MYVSLCMHICTHKFWFSHLPLLCFSRLATTLRRQKKARSRMQFVLMASRLFSFSLVASAPRRLVSFTCSNGAVGNGANWALLSERLTIAHPQWEGQRVKKQCYVTFSPPFWLAFQTKSPFVRGSLCARAAISQKKNYVQRRQKRTLRPPGIRSCKGKGFQ